MSTGQIIEKNQSGAPDFIDDIDPMVVLETMHTLCEKLAADQSDATLKEIQQKLKSWEIITIKQGNDTKWITHPFSVQITKKRRTMTARIMHLIRSLGEWQGECVEQRVIEAPYLMTVPFALSVLSAKNKKNTPHPLLIKLVHLATDIEKILKDGSSFVGIFEKPNATRNMNLIHAWLRDNELNPAVSVKDTLAVTNLYEIIHQTTIIQEKLETHTHE